MERSTNGFLGIDYNNWFCVKQPGRNRSQWWRGSLGIDDRGHAIFVHPLFGARAAYRILGRYQLERGAQTLNQMMAIYAPKDDTVGSLAGAPPNDPNAYADFISKRINFPAHIPLEIIGTDWRPIGTYQLIGMLKAIAEHEIFPGFRAPQDVIESGIALAEREWGT